MQLSDEYYSHSSDFGEVRVFSVYVPTRTYTSLDVIESAGWHRVNKKYHILRECGADASLILFTMSGKGKITIGTQQFCVTSNMVCMIPAHTACEYMPEGEELWEFYWIHFSGSHAVSVFTDLIHATGYSGQFPVDTICPLLEQMLFTQYSSLNGELLASIQLNQILSELLMVFCINKEENSVVNEILLYISAEQRSVFSMEDLVKRYHYSKEYMIRLFHTKVGTTPYQYWRRIRMEKAKQVLALSDQPISDIAIQAGYTTVESFNKQFHAFYGVTPRRYRMENQKKE